LRPLAPNAEVIVLIPGGRIGVIVRAADMPWLINLPLPAPVKQKVEAPGVLGGGVGEGGCADASLYTRFHRAGLAEIQMLVQFSTLHSGPTFQNMATTCNICGRDHKDRMGWHFCRRCKDAEGEFSGLAYEGGDLYDRWYCPQCVEKPGWHSGLHPQPKRLTRCRHCGTFLQQEQGALKGLKGLWAAFCYYEDNRPWWGRGSGGGVR